ncbi:MAG: type II secretion system F family protein [Patescibacteria group bacterium]|nr:type II secretion system F family protein [Patescibacteria group bacterium]
MSTSRPTKPAFKTDPVSLSNQDKVALLTNLSTMLSAGIPLLEVIDSLLEDIRGPQKRILKLIREDIIQGKHLYEAFSRFPNVFSQVTINVVKAAEEAGGLDTTLKQVKNQMVKDMEFHDKIVFAMIYPALIMILLVGMMLMMLVVVIPKISQVFSKLNVDLPLPTKILVWLSNTLLQNTIPIIIGLVAIGFASVYLYRRNKNLILQPLIRLPLITSLVTKIDLTTFSRSLSSLLSAGIPITSALELTENVVIKKDISRVIRMCKEMILAGKSFSAGLKANKGEIPTLMIKIIETGERSGSLDRSLGEISEYMDYSATNDLRAVTALLEPIMLITVGLLIGGIMVSIIAPIYGLIGSVGAR